MPPEIAVVPPISGLCSRTRTLRPSAAAVAAALKPAAPAPMTITSYTSILSCNKRMPADWSAPHARSRCRSQRQTSLSLAAAGPGGMGSGAVEHAAAIDQYGHAGDKGGLIAGQEQRGVGDV